MRWGCDGALMEKRTLILSGGRNAVTLVTENNTLVATRRSAPVAQALILVVCTLLLAGFLFPFFFLVGRALIATIAEKSLLAFVLGIAVLALCILAVPYCLWLQGLFFSTTVRIDMHRRLYLLRNGIIAARLSLPPGTTISIVPVYSSGDWGYAAKLKRNWRILHWPIIPPTLIGTKFDAFMEAKSIKKFIEKGVPSLNVSLDRWGTEEIIPGVDYFPP